MLEVSTYTILAAVIVYKLIDKVIEFFWNRTAKAEYVTKEECKQCSAKTAVVNSELCRDLKQIKKILLVVAATAGIKNEELKELVT